MTFANESDFISFRHHVFQKVKENVQLAEVGPRFEMKRKMFVYFLQTLESHMHATVYEIKLGTLDVDEADKEWVLRPYQRTAKKRDFM